MKRAALIACLLAFTTPAFAQAPSATGGPITNQAERDAIASRVRGGASCANCDLFQISLAYQAIPGRNFSGARIRQADLSLATADRARFHGANMSLTNFFGARLSGADLSDTNLEGTTFVGAYLGGAHMNGAVLTGANLSGAELADAVGITQAQLNTACGDATTTLPAGMTVPACGNNQ
ncbi:MAG: pentapeptide repeat-containing protein [Caulobacteraceae bacterium]|nr:pentapeptide repeat-containing protein [Caulobacteraceae bacterium]